MVRETIEQLRQQYGVSRWYNFIEVVYLPSSPLFLENRERFYVPSYTPTTLVPPAEFCCDFGRRLRRWMPAREIIDWSLPAKSVFNRERPLADKTMRRIWSGFKKFALPQIPQQKTTAFMTPNGSGEIADRTP